MVMITTSNCPALSNFNVCLCVGANSRGRGRTTMPPTAKVGVTWVRTVLLPARATSPSVSRRSSCTSSGLGIVKDGFDEFGRQRWRACRAGKGDRAGGSASPRLMCRSRQTRAESDARRREDRACKAGLALPLPHHAASELCWGMQDIAACCASMCCVPVVLESRCMPCRVPRCSPS